MSNDLMRFSVAMPEDLLVKFDHLVAVWLKIAVKWYAI